MNECYRCGITFKGKYQKSKVCKGCSLRGMPRGTGHWNYQDGSFTYETFRKEVKQQVRFCQRCNKDLKDVTRHSWVIHHRDHNHYNNDRSNLELLCKSCHQKEHKVHLNFQGATTISKESTSK